MREHWAGPSSRPRSNCWTQPFLQVLFDEFTAGVVIAKQGVHLAGLGISSMKRKLDGFVQDPGEERLELMIIEPLEQHGVDLGPTETGNQGGVLSLPSPPPACSRR